MSHRTVTHSSYLSLMHGLTSAAALALVLDFVNPAAADWPTYRHDAARSGITAETIELPLAERWVFKPRQAPQAAWGDPKSVPVEGILELRRTHFDDVFHVAAVDGAVYFGSSTDNKIYCLDADTGQIRWTKITGGPVRLAPTVVDGRVYVGSDDGHAYCLNAADGSVEWKFRAAPEDRRVLGHGRMISLWPLRTSVLVDDGVAYLGAGVFPAEGVFLYAVDAGSGKEIWRNDTCGEDPQSRVSPQGYLLASPSTIYAPMGRTSPAAFDRANGELKFENSFGKNVGGTYALLAGEHVYTGTEEMVAFHGQSRDRFASFDGRKLVVAGDTAYVATETELSALDRTTFPAASRKLYALRVKKTGVDRSIVVARRIPNLTEPQQKELDRLEAQVVELAEQLEQAQQAFDACMRWRIPCDCNESLILAGDRLVAGGEGKLIAVETASGEVAWKADVDSTVKGLAVAGRRLLASTTSGALYSFGPQKPSAKAVVVKLQETDTFAESKLAPMFQAAAEQIIRRSGIQRGYCLVLGCPTGQLAVELAKRSELMIYVVDPDAENVAAARRAIDLAGFYGDRISVEQWPDDDIPYADYFANLIVSETALLSGTLPKNTAEIARMLKPCGGTLLVGQPAELPGEVKPLPVDELTAWLEKLSPTGGKLATDDGLWTQLVRRPLPGAGSWTHQYAEPGNTACGDDRIVKAPLGVLWFGRPGPGEMVNRHYRAAGPLSVGGRLFIQGEEVISAHDIYNGLELWRREIPGAMRVSASHDGSNLAADDRSLFVAVADKCLRLDAETGRTIHTYPLPDDEAGSTRWGYVATVDGILLGTAGTAPQQSNTLFAVDVSSGRTLWTYAAKRISHNSIAVGDGRIHLVDSSVSPQNRLEVVDPSDTAADVRRVSALDLNTGKVVWRRPVDLTGCGGGYPAAMYNNGVLVVFGVYLDGHFWQQFFAGQFDSRRVVALAGDDGRQIWSRDIGYRVRPLIVGDTLHAEPWAFDLHTGEPETRLHPVTGQTGRWQFARPGHHCGCPCASPNCLFFRSYCIGYYDLVEDSGTMHFGAQRPGCWINFIPAGGLLLVPEASTGCMCPFPNMCTVAFEPTDRDKGFAFYSAEGSMTPVQRLAVNFGAAGDRRDSDGNLWLAYPRPYKGRLVMDFDLETEFYRGGDYSSRNSSYTPVAETDDAWLFASAAAGLKKCVIPLLDQADGTALYRVRLALSDPENDRPGARLFDVKLQGIVVEQNLDVAAQSAGRDRALFLTFDNIRVDDRLVIELVSKTADPKLSQAPLLQGVEVTRQEIVSLGCQVPSFLLDDGSPLQTGELRLANLRDEPFEGTLEISAPEGFQVNADRSGLELPPGRRMKISLDVAVSENAPTGMHSAVVKLVRTDGSIELERNIPIEHLGRRRRVTFTAVEDSDVVQRYGATNRGTRDVMLIDGGNSEMGDEAHALGYLKFAVDVPGVSKSVRLVIHNAGNLSSNSGRVCLVDGTWSESRVTYDTRPATGKELAQLGRVEVDQVVQCLLEIKLQGVSELSLVVDPTSRDGVDYLSRESQSPPKLIVEYEPNE